MNNYDFFAEETDQQETTPGRYFGIKGFKLLAVGALVAGAAVLFSENKETALPRVEANVQTPQPSNFTVNKILGYTYTP